jgi:hypothetical protein
MLILRAASNVVLDARAAGTIAALRERVEMREWKGE